MKTASLVLVSVLLFSACTNEPTKKKTAKVKNVILMIGDGMGPGQISLLHHFFSKSDKAKNYRFAFNRLAEKAPVAISTNEPHRGIVVDSACSATQLAIGKPSRPEMIGLDKEGNPVKTILELAKEKGLATGLVSDTRITHATPASFASHAANRWSEDEIAKGLIETAPDVLLSGGANRFLPRGEEKTLGDSYTVKSKRGDDVDLLQEAEKKGYQLVYDRTGLNDLNKNQKLLGLFTGHSFPNALWFKRNSKDPERKIPDLLEMSKAAISKLSQNREGFFLMIEGGQIDWAAHQNDAGTMLHELLSFNRTLNWVIDWVDQNPDTLLVVTADHETGGFGLGYNVHDLPKPSRLKGEAFENKVFQPGFNYGSAQSIDLLYQQERSFMEIWKEFQSLKPEAKSAKKLANMVSAYTGMDFSLKAAQRVLENEKNPYHDPSHALMKNETLGKVDFNRAYYFDPDNIRTSLIAQGLSPRQNVVWGTGGHTATEVHVYSRGPEAATSQISGRLSHPRLGLLMQELLNLKTGKEK